MKISEFITFYSSIAILDKPGIISATTETLQGTNGAFSRLFDINGHLRPIGAPKVNVAMTTHNANMFNALMAALETRYKKDGDFELTATEERVCRSFFRNFVTNKKFIEGILDFQVSVQPYNPNSDSAEDVSMDIMDVFEDYNLPITRADILKMSTLQFEYKQRTLIEHAAPAVNSLGAKAKSTPTKDDEEAFAKKLAARRLARQSQLDNDSGSPTEEQLNDAHNKLQAYLKAKADLDADPTKADSKKTYNKALAALKATDQGLYDNLSEDDKVAYQAALTATNA